MEKLIEFLMVEDNPCDIRSVQECFKGNKIVNRLSIVQDGDELQAFLNQQGRFAQSPPPDVILFSLSTLLPDRGSILAEITQNPSFKHIPIILLTALRHRTYQPVHHQTPYDGSYPPHR